jgi:hypothetical protein
MALPFVLVLVGLVMRQLYARLGQFDARQETFSIKLDRIAEVITADRVARVRLEGKLDGLEQAIGVIRDTSRLETEVAQLKSQLEAWRASDPRGANP